MWYVDMIFLSLLLYVSREKNKEIARNVREKKKDKLSVLEQNIQYLKSLNKSLMSQVTQFRSMDNNNNNINSMHHQRYTKLTLIVGILVLWSTRHHHHHHHHHHHRTGTATAAASITVSYDHSFTDLIHQTLQQLKFSHATSAYYVINATSYFFPIIYASPPLAALTGDSVTWYQLTAHAVNWHQLTAHVANWHQLTVHAANWHQLPSPDINWHL